MARDQEAHSRRPLILSTTHGWYPKPWHMPPGSFGLDALPTRLQPQPHAFPFRNDHGPFLSGSQTGHEQDLQWFPRCGPEILRYTLRALIPYDHPAARLRPRFLDFSMISSWSARQAPASEEGRLGGDGLHQSPET
jgi:hypothetical protein